MDKRSQFLEELSELSKKYEIYIDGCGCCDSPYLTEREPEHVNGEMGWDRDEKKYVAF